MHLMCAVPGGQSAPAVYSVHVLHVARIVRVVHVVPVVPVVPVGPMAPDVIVVPVGISLHHAHEVADGSELWAAVADVVTESCAVIEPHG